MRIGLLMFVIFSTFSISGQMDLSISGMTLVAPRDSFSSNPMTDIVNINCKWIAVVPYSFTPQNESKVYFNNGHQWWGETPQGAESTIKIAKENGLKVMLKPQVWMHGSWIGDLKFDNEEDWKSWESDYRDYILTFARIAQNREVELFCIGTEFKKAVVLREKFWRQLIQEVRMVYDGLLTYSANWDEFEDMPLWDALDVMGVSAYFPLTEVHTPEINDLIGHWKPIRKKLNAISNKYGKQILFTEYGYLSVNGCAGKTWELEKIRRELPCNELAQSNALEGLYSAFCDEPFWAGGFMWKWYPNGRIRPGHRENDYTPQGKLAEKTIAKWYEELNSR